MVVRRDVWIHCIKSTVANGVFNFSEVFDSPPFHYARCQFFCETMGKYNFEDNLIVTLFVSIIPPDFIHFIKLKDACEYTVCQNKPITFIKGAYF